MPTVARFHGITIRMFFLGSEHNPPHIHVEYGGCVAALEIETGRIIDGMLPKSAVDSAQEWVRENKDVLLQMWSSQEFRKID